MDGICVVTMIVTATEEMTMNETEEVTTTVIETEEVTMIVTVTEEMTVAGKEITPVVVRMNSFSLEPSVVFRIREPVVVKQRKNKCKRERHLLAFPSCKTYI